MIALSIIEKEIRSARLSLRALLRNGFTYNGAFLSGYRKRIIHLRITRRVIASAIEKEDRDERFAM